VEATVLLQILNSEEQVNLGRGKGRWLTSSLAETKYKGVDGGTNRQMKIRQSNCFNQN
jgi:hypothetical protein